MLDTRGTTPRQKVFGHFATFTGRSSTMIGLPGVIMIFGRFRVLKIGRYESVWED